MFPILFIILFLFCQSESAFYDPDNEKLQSKRNILSEKLILSLKIKDDFLSLAHDLDSIRKSDIIKSKIDCIANKISTLKITNATEILDHIKQIASPAQDIQREAQRIRSRFISLQQSALILAASPGTEPANSTNIDNGLKELLTNANTPALASIESFLQFKKLADEAKAINDSLITYKRFADSIRLYGENAFSKFTRNGQDSLRKYLSLLENSSIYTGITDSVAKYSNFQDTLIDRLGFPAILTRSQLADSVKQYIKYRDSLRSKMEQLSATTIESEKQRLTQEIHKIKAAKADYEYLRDTIAHYSGSPTQLAAVIPSNPSISSALSVIAGQKSLENAGREMALTLGRSLFPQGSKIMDSVQKYFRFYSNIMKEDDYKKSLTLAETEEQKDIIRLKLLAVSGYADSLRNYKHYRDSLLFRIPIPTWVGEGQTWLDSLKRFVIIKDSLVLMAKELSATPGRYNVLAPKIRFYKDSIGKYINMADSIGTYFSSPGKIIPHTPLTKLFEQADTYSNPDSINKYNTMKDKLFSEGALMLMAFVSNSSALPFVTNLLGTVSTIKNEAEALLNGKKSMADIAISAGMAIGNTLFPDKMALFQSAQTYFKLAADVKELPTLQRELAAYSSYTNMLSMDNVTVANTLTKAGIDSLASYRTLLARQAELLQSQASIETYRPYLDSLADRLPIPEWIGKGLPWEAGIKRYGALRDSIKLIEQDIVDQGTNNVTALQVRLTELKNSFEPYKHFRDTIKKYIESPELLIAHTPMSDMFKDGENALLKEQLGSQGTLALMAFAGSATSLPIVGRIMGPTAKLMAFQDSLTHYLEIIKDLRSKVDTFEILLKDPFRIMTTFPNVKTLFDYFGIQVSSVTFPPVNNLLSELRNFIRPYLAEVDKLIKYGNETKTLADEIPGREAFFKGFIGSIKEVSQKFSSGLRVTSNQAIMINNIDNNCDTGRYTGFEFFYSNNTYSLSISDTAAYDTAKEDRTVLSYTVNFIGTHSANISHQGASTISGGEIKTEVTDHDASQSDRQWEKDGVNIFAIKHFTDIAAYENDAKKTIKVSTKDSLIEFELVDDNWKIFFNKKMNKPWPVKVLTKVVSASMNIETISGLPVTTSIRFSPAAGGDDFMSWSLNRKGVILGNK